MRFTAPVASARYENGALVPGAGHRCLIAFGNNDNTGNNPEWDNCNALVLATGDTDNEIVLYRFSGRRATVYDGNTGRPAQQATEQTSKVLFRKQVADATSAAHTVSVVYDGDTMAFYLDGAYIDATKPGALQGYGCGADGGNVFPGLVHHAEQFHYRVAVPQVCSAWQAAGTWGLLPADAPVNKGENLFPRIDMEKELKALEELHAQAQAAAQAEQAPEYITIDDFNKVHFVTAKILDCQPVKKSKKLLCFTLDCGEGRPRQILSGIHEYYEPEELIGKTVVACTNLAPRKMMGLESNGMLISAVKEEPDGSEKLHLIMLDDKVPAGYGLC